MGKGSELLALLKTGNSGEARKTVTKLKKQGKKKVLAVLNEQDEEGCTPLHYSAAYNFLDFIEDFLELGAVVDVEDNKGYTPLHLAATNGRAEAVSVLLCRGADPDISSRSGDTPIHLASHNGHSECVENLIREHAKCTMLNVSGQNPLDLACQNGHTEVVALLLRSGQFNPQRTETSQTSLKLAAKHGHTQVLSVLIKHGFDVNRVLPGAHGTCLHEAALYGKIEAVHYLLQCGANPSIKNTQGLTALDIVNHYTDPRSAQQLKQLLKDAVSKNRMSQQYQQQVPSQPMAASNQRYSYTLPHNASQQQQPPPSPSQQHGGYHAATLPHTGTHQHGQTSSGLPQQHQGTVPGDQHQPILHSSTQPQLLQHQQQQQQQQRAAMHKQMSMPVSYNPVTQQHTGIPSMAEMIAAKASQRKPMSTSPTRRDDQRDNEGILRSATLSGMTRPNIDRSAILKRRNSYSEESEQQQSSSLPYNRSNPPTLPRRAHPPTFKPVPPPSDDQQNHIVSQEKFTTPNVPQTTPNVHQATPNIQQQTVPAQKPAPPLPEPISTNQNPPSFSEQIALLAAKKHATASNTPPSEKRDLQPHPPRNDPQPHPPNEKKEPHPPSLSMENELIAKLKRRKEASNTQPTIDTSTIESTTPSVEPKPITTPPTNPKPSVPPQGNPQESSGPPSPSKPAPKPKPKPSKGIVPKEEEQNKPLTWQEELAKRRSGSVKEDTPEKGPVATPTTAPPPTKPKTSPAHEPKKIPPTIKAKPKPLSDHNKPHPVEQPKPHPVEQPKPHPVEQPKPVEQPHPVEQPKPMEPPKPHPMEQPIQHPVEQPKPHPVEQPKPRPSVEEPPIQPVSQSHEDNPLISKVIEDDRPSTPSTVDQQMSRSTSFSSVASVPISTTPGPVHSHQFGSECVPIAEWLATYKLTEYLPGLQSSGYDNTDFMIGITPEELAEVGVVKTGHKKRILSSLSQLLPKEHYLTFKPASVAEWLQLLGLSQYESVMMDNGYDDIEFITSVTEDELVEIGISKKGHLKRLKKGIDELSEMQGEPTTPSLYVSNPTDMVAQSPTHSTSNWSSISNERGVPANEKPLTANERGILTNELTVADTTNTVQLRPKPHPLNEPPTSHVVPAPQTSVPSSNDSGIDSNSSKDKRQSGANFIKMKHMLEKNMGLAAGEGEEEGDTGNEATPTTSETTPTNNETTVNSSVKMRPKAAGPPPIPKRATSTIVTTVPNPAATPPQIQKRQSDQTDYGVITTLDEPSSVGTLLTTEDIDKALDEVPLSPDDNSTAKQSHPATKTSLIPELDELDKALQGFTDIDGDEDLTPPAIEDNTHDDDEEMLKKFEEEACKEMEDELKTDQMLADIDDMLADLNTHLDIMIPPSS